MYCANDLYAITEYTSSRSIDALIGPSGCHISEAGCYSDLQEIKGQLDRVEVRCLHYEDFDGRAGIWLLNTVWFDGKPIMVTQNAGREGRDHRARFITDPVAYMEMVAYIRALAPVVPLYDQTDPTMPIKGLTHFYDHECIF